MLDDKQKLIFTLNPLIISLTYKTWFVILFDKKGQSTVFWTVALMCYSNVMDSPKTKRNITGLRPLPFADSVLNSGATSFVSEWRQAKTPRSHTYTMYAPNPLYHTLRCKSSVKQGHDLKEVSWRGGRIYREASSSRETAGARKFHHSSLFLPSSLSRITRTAGRRTFATPASAYK